MSRTATYHTTVRWTGEHWGHLVMGNGPDMEFSAPPDAHRHAGVEGLVLSQEGRVRLFQELGAEVVSSGSVAYEPAKLSVPTTSPRSFEKGIFEACAIMVIAPCVADLTKTRLIVPLSGKLAAAFPYLNAEMPQAMFCQEAGPFTHMDGYRLMHLKAPFLEICSSLGHSELALTGRGA